MPELLEQDWGYDDNVLGFPSISACRAVVLETTAGLFGYHMASGHTNAPAKAKSFAQYVHAHRKWTAGSAKYLYVVTYLQGQTGYTGGQEISQWRAEAKVFADALQAGVRRFGFGMTEADAKGSAYVKIIKAAGLATVKIGRWHSFGEFIEKGITNGSPDHGGLFLANPRDNVRKVDVPDGNLKTVNLQALDI